MSRILGILLIVLCILVFISSLNRRLEKNSSGSRTGTGETMRITADRDEGKLYLWGAKKGAVLKASTPITYTYEQGFYIITMETVEQPYLLEVFAGERRVAKFRYFAGEKYPVYAD